MKYLLALGLQLEVLLVVVVLPGVCEAHHISQGRVSQRTKLGPGGAGGGEGGEHARLPSQGGELEGGGEEAHRHRHEGRQRAEDELAWTTASPSLDGDGGGGGDPAANSLDIRSTRIELIKRQILEKLRLADRPNTTHERVRLPQPLSIAGLSRDPLHRARAPPPQPAANDDFYGTTKQVILLGHQIDMAPSAKPSACFSFSFADRDMLQNARTAELWVYKKRDPSDSHKRNQTILVSELEVADDDDDGDDEPARPKLLAVEKTSKIKRGWVKFDMTHAVNRWFHRGGGGGGGEEKNETLLVVSCKTCSMDAGLSPVETDGDFKPLLVIYTSKRRGRRVAREAGECNPAANECCKEHFEVSFVDIGWSDWILQPASYEANFCKGTCADPTRPLLAGDSGTHHSSVMMRAGSRERDSGRREELLPCCTASRMSGVSLLYRDEEGNILKTDLPNMKVDACGCA